MDDPSLDVARPSGPAKDPFHEGAARARARRLRSLAIALALIAFVVIVFITTINHLAANVRQSQSATPTVAHRPAAAP